MYYFMSSNRTPKLINTKYNSFCTQKCLRGVVDGKLQCNCGEDVSVFDWCWSETNSSVSAKLSNNNKEILFHPVYSSGTSAAKGNVVFEQNLHYYWEIKMISNVYGTDVMVGVGTTKVDISDWKFEFCSMLGIDSQSWGYSYVGYKQHNKLKCQYGTPFGLGSIIGVHLDMCSGTLEYYINRKPLGIAFRGLKGQDLNPMVSSTAAQSAVRITCSVCEEPTLQMICLQLVVKHPFLYKKYRKIAGLTRLYDRQYFWIVPSNEPDERKRLAELDEDVTLSLIDPSYLSKNKRFRPFRWLPEKLVVDDSGSDESFVYNFDAIDTNEESRDAASTSMLDHDVQSITRTDYSSSDESFIYNLDNSSEEVCNANKKKEGNFHTFSEKVNDTNDKSGDAPSTSVLGHDEQSTMK